MQLQISGKDEFTVCETCDANLKLMGKAVALQLLRSDPLTATKLANAPHPIIIYYLAPFIRGWRGGTKVNDVHSATFLGIGSATVQTNT
eukprot:1330219-Pyramimonas_sp.AAC.1